jgi:biopolymer transport protein ExbD
MGPGMTAGGSRLEINLTPLLDLVLQLIMFFMLTVNFVCSSPLDDTVDLPVAQSAMPVSVSADNLVYIAVDEHGQRSAGSIALDTSATLRRHIQTRQAEVHELAQERGLTGPATVLVVVRAHRDAPWGAVWDTLEECSRAGCHGWQLRVIKQAA